MNGPAKQLTFDQELMGFPCWSRDGKFIAFEIDRFAQFEESKGKTLEELLDEFAALRERNLTTLGEIKIGVDDLEKTGQHPALGRVTLKELLATWVTHDLDHIAQIARTMAKQYTTEVGPWQAYVSILHDRKKSPTPSKSLR